MGGQKSGGIYQAKPGRIVVQVDEGGDASRQPKESDLTSIPWVRETDKPARDAAKKKRKGQTPGVIIRVNTRQERKKGKAQTTLCMKAGWKKVEMTRALVPGSRKILGFGCAPENGPPGVGGAGRLEEPSPAQRANSAAVSKRSPLRQGQLPAEGRVLKKKQYPKTKPAQGKRALAAVPQPRKLFPAERTKNFPKRYKKTFWVEADATLPTTKPSGQKV